MGVGMPHVQWECPGVVVLTALLWSRELTQHPQCAVDTEGQRGAGLRSQESSSSGHRTSWDRQTECSLKSDGIQWLRVPCGILDVWLSVFALFSKSQLDAVFLEQAEVSV